MGCDRIGERLEAIEGLPTIPLVVRQIQKVMGNEQASMAQIAAVVAKDQSLSSRAIRLVNSAWYGRAGRVSSIQQVLVTLGLKTLSGLMLGLSVVKMFDSSRTLGFDAHAFWEHSFGTALLAKKLAVDSGENIDPEECFIAGLLHDMGRLVMEQYLHEDYVATLELVRSSGSTLLAAEENVFGFSHADTGAWLGRKWGVPGVFIASMEFHHAARLPSDVPKGIETVVRAVALANELCMDGKIGASGEVRNGSGTHEVPRGWSTDKRTRFVEEARAGVASTLREWNSV